MKYHLETIPVWDAYHAGGECPLCTLQAQCEQQYLEYSLGASMMEPDVRVETNDKGFCAQHFAMMFAMGNRLGLALMTHTHWLERQEKFQGDVKALQGALARAGGKASPAELVHKAPWQRAAQQAAEALRARDATCVVCEKIRATMDRYLYTVLYLYGKDAEFAKTFDASKGVCLPHASALFALVAKESGAGAQRFAQALVTLLEENAQRLAEELEWFTLKFDYRNQDKPWGTSRDALERTLQKLKGARLLPATEEK